MLTRKSRCLLFAAPALLACGTSLGWFLQARELQLLPRAVKAADISGAYPGYWWLSDRKILLCRNSGNGAWLLRGLDLATGREESAGQINELFSSSRGTPESIQVAPGGAWLLWNAGDGRTLVASIDGRKRYEYPKGLAREKRWMSEGLRWIELVQDGSVFTGAVVHSVIRPHFSQRKPIVPTISCSPQEVNLASMTPTTDDHILATLWNGRKGGISPAFTVALVLNAHISSAGKFKLHPPRPADSGELVFAPIYGRVAWVVNYRPSWFGLFRQPDRTGIWVAEMRDWRAVDLGSLETSGDGIRSVQWSPDGGRLGFVYRGAVWTVSADG